MRSGRPVSAFASAKRGHEEFADQAARHDDALVDIERHALDIGAVQEIGGGLAGRRPRFDEIAEPRPFARRRSLASRNGSSVSIGRLETLENEKGGFVEGGGRAVAEGEVGGEKAADRVAQPVARGEERLDPLVAIRVSQGRPHPGRPLIRRSCTRAGNACASCLAAPGRRPFARIRSISRTARPDPARGRQEAERRFALGAAARRSHAGLLRGGDEGQDRPRERKGEPATANQGRDSRRSGIPVRSDGSCGPGAGYKDRGRDFKLTRTRFRRRELRASSAARTAGGSSSRPSPARGSAFQRRNGRKLALAYRAS